MAARGQVHASIALLKQGNIAILKQHMNTCVRHAVRTDRRHDKIEEIVDILDKYLA